MARQVAILTDAHALYEPIEAILKDIEKRGIKEVYSLGDNIGLGPNPNEIIETFANHNIQSIKGNYEEYELLGIAPFKWYMTDSKIKSRNWTSSVLKPENKKLISLYPHSIDLTLGGKKIALCHFANDVRFDYICNDSWGYVNKIKNGMKGYEQFLYTNSPEQIIDMKKEVDDTPDSKGILSALNDPLFGGKTIKMYDSIIQGHAHWKLFEQTPFGTIYSIRAAGMAYDTDPLDSASYVILTETDNGFTCEEVLVKYDREKMIHSINTSTSPDRDISRYTCI